MRVNTSLRGAVGRISLGLALGTAVGASALAAAHPVQAAAALVALENAVTCSSPQACYSATNSSTGSGVAGTSSKGIGMQGKGAVGVKGIATTSYGLQGLSTSSYGVLGSSTSGQAGVAGTTANSYGVYGYTTGSSGGTGVYGQSVNGYGVYGTTTNPGGTGVIGQESGGGAGVYGSNDSGFGTEGISSTGYGLYGNAYGGGTAAYLSAASGYGLISLNNGGGGSGVALYGKNSAGNGADVTGTYIGLVARTPTSGFPLVATDSNSNNLFYVDGSGNVSYHGGLFHFARVGGVVVKSFNANTSAPTMEDTGTAQLVAGTAAVRLDPTFAASIDAMSSYRVFVTPNGDTKGLFVATKTAGGFIVRESQGGRSTVSFDYRIVATAAGQGGERMGRANPAADPRAVALDVPHLKTPAIPVHP